jgi:hypothetical protein
VTEPADLAHGALIRVAEFIRKLPADQIADLASGEAKLELVPKGGRPVPARRASSGGALPRPAQEIARTMAEIANRAAVRQYLEKDLKLTLGDLKQLAAELGFTVSGTKAKMLDGVVEWGAGRRLDADAISRAGGGAR